MISRSGGLRGVLPAIAAAWLAAMGLVATALVARGEAGVTRTGGVLLPGTRWETPYYVQTSDRPGPTVIISGGVHGDEPAGAAAAEEIRQWPICCGKLVVLPRANPPGLAAKTRLMPDVPKEQGNLNRNFPKAGQSGPPVGEPAQAIWDWVCAIKPTWLVDLHEGTGIRGAGSTSVGSSVIICRTSETERAAKLILEAVNASIQDERHKFVIIEPAVDGSLARAASAHLGARSMILETSINDLPPPATKATVSKDAGTKATGSKETGTKATGNKDATAAPPKPKQQPLSRRVRQHRLMVQALLRHLGMIDESL